MISICIPVYNFNVSDLVNELTNQMNSVQEDIELIVIDDASDDEFKNIHKNCLTEHVYIELPKNIGRSKIRNMFTKYATHDYLLFLDCDVKLLDGKFLKNYIESIKKQSACVVCGGLLYPKQVPEKEYFLRWKYGINRECRSVKERNKNIYGSFMTSNFVIKKNVLKAFPFNEKIRQYGHEDTLLGFNLKLANKKILHINNPLIHADKESNKSYVNKVEKATQNLYHILNMIPEKESLINDIRLLSYVRKFHQNGVNFLVLWIFKIVKKALKFGFISGNITSLVCFDFYKLGVYLEYENKCLKKGVN